MGDNNKRTDSISVFFPCHNEVENISSLTEKTYCVLQKYFNEFEILLINDGSTDGTYEVAEELATKYPEVKAVHHEVNKGYGGAVWTGIKSSTKDLLFFTDGDGQFDTEEIALLLQHIDKYDAVLGYRMKRNDPFHRLLFAKAWGTLIRILFGIKLKDLDCAFKLFHRKLFEGLSQEAGGAMVTVEFMFKLIRRGLTYKQVGVHHYPRTAGIQSGGSIKVIFRAFRELFALHSNLKSFK